MKIEVDKERVIIITGAAGMIGSCIVRCLNDLGHTNLLLVDNLDIGFKWKNILGKSFIKLIGISEVFDWIESNQNDVEAIIHMGACSDTLEKRGDYLMDNNYHYTIKLAEFALERSVRFIYASSAATYGDGSKGFSDDESQLKDLEPLNLYGFSKHLFDLWALNEGVLDTVVGLKYFNVFGPNEAHKGRMASMIFKMFPIVQEKGVLELFKSSDPAFSDGGQQRDFIYVKDAARITCDFLSTRGGGIFNVGSGTPTTWNYLADQVFKACGIPTKIHYIPMPEDLVKQYQNYTCAEVGKLASYFNRQAKEPLCQFSTSEAVFDYVQEYLAKDKRW